MLKKILCPGNHHRKHNFNKFLVAYKDNGNMAGVELVVHCDGMKCKRWYKVVFNTRGAPVVSELPKNYHFDFDCDPVLVKGDNS